MSDIENPNSAVEEPDTLEPVRDQAADKEEAAEEKAGQEKAEEEKDDDDEESDDDESGYDDDSDDDDDDDDADEVGGDDTPAKADAVEEASEPVETSADAVIETVAAEAVVVSAIAASAAVAQATGENVTNVGSPDHAQHLRLLEALIFAGAQALDEKELVDRLPDDADVKRLLADLAELYAGRGVNLVQVAGGYAFRTAPDLSEKLKIEKPVTRKLSRASVETLAIIAYHQPVTRAEIEQVRGVGLSKGTLDLLFEQNWIKPMGRRRAPGKPVTWGTTDFFLEHFGLPSLDDLPGHEELKAAGLLDARSQPPIFRPDEPDLPLEPTEDEADEPLAVEEGPAEAGR
ncbi:MAG: SMC-Scp complex subunit ScpB, partial [Reyranella sp.]|uniref:SMC-Scp complex subunit ScpB n=1 Tax=Reyranella sp. TaxID=1929291 RepID=UPI0012112ED3